MYAAVTVDDSQVVLRRDQMLVENREIELDFLIGQIEKALRERAYVLNVV